MDLRVLGCHGGETIKHRTSSFLINGRIAIDAGAVTSMLTLEEQLAIDAVLVSHAHLDHVRDLATLADNRCQMGGRPLVIASTTETLAALKTHFFNDVVWPDFSQIPNPRGEPTLVFQELVAEKTVEIAGAAVTPVMVHHTIDTCGFIVDAGSAALAYSGDTGPTDRLWEVLGTQKNLRALLMEVSFPNAHHQLAKDSAHHTPETLDRELEKLKNDPNLPIMLYHIKPVFQDEVERELAKITKRNLHICQLGEQYVL
ncbi:MAG: 3',5'-cyclic-nucleotide phosphodiesterase [Sandaracinaceae bacterium]|jgi:ribonuclease BN (tRNA processing enzyme)|nr:3',5'-cyclic-nucleotide phosphodiesterase [Sandaracinaceae bacterium]